MSVKYWCEKLIPFLIIFATLGTYSYAQGGPFVIPFPAGTPMVSGTPMQSVNQACDKYGVCAVAVTSGGGTGETQSVIPVSNAVDLNGPLSSINGYFNVGTDTIEAASTTTVLNLTSHAARVGDLITPTGGTAGNVDVAIPVCSTTTNTVTLCYPLPATPSTDAILIKRPTPLYSPKVGGTWLGASSSPGIMALGIRNDSFATTLGSDQTHSTFSVDLKGRIGIAGTQFEDAAAASGDPLVGVAAQRISNPSTLTSTALDYGTFTIDSANRLLVNDYGAPIRATIQACSAEETGTADELILSAGGGTIRNYITGISCTNNSVVPSRIAFKSAATAIWYGSIPALANGGTYVYSFKTPLRGGSNEAINFALTTTATATICCAVGFGSDEAS